MTARTDTPDVTAGLEASADDYVTKPLVASELAAAGGRIVTREQLLQRGSGEAPGTR